MCLFLEYEPLKKTTLPSPTASSSLAPSSQLLAKGLRFLDILGGVTLTQMNSVPWQVRPEWTLFPGRSVLNQNELCSLAGQYWTRLNYVPWQVSIDPDELSSLAGQYWTRWTLFPGRSPMNHITLLTGQQNWVSYPYSWNMFWLNGTFSISRLAANVARPREDSSTFHNKNSSFCAKQILL